MKKKQRLDYRRERRKSITRYLSIMLIVALGVAFFTGVRSSEPDMKLSVDEYYDSVNFYDLRLASTIGFTEEDLTEIANTEGVSAVESLYFTEMFYKTEEIKYVLSLYSVTDSINTVTVTEGRLPSNETECLLDSNFAKNSGLAIGSTITFTAETGKEVSESLKGDTYTVVGLGTSANHLTFDRGTANIGTGKSDGYVFLHKSAFSYEVYTQIYVTVDDAKTLRCFEDKYQDKIDAINTKITEIGAVRCQTRVDDYRAKTTAILNEITATYEAQKLAAEEQFSKALKQIQLGEAAITNARITIRNSKTEIEEIEASFPELQANIDLAQQNLDNKSADIEKWKAKLPALEDAYDEAKKAFDAAKKAYKKAETEENKLILEECEQTLQIADSQLTVANRNIDEGIEICEEELKIATDLVNEANAKIAELNKTIEKNTAYITKTEEEVKKARETYNAQKLESDTILNDAQAKIDLVAKQVNALDGAQWYVLDRNTVQNYVEFLSDAEKVGALGTVFPIIFFIVAALISLTTMTRMVEEQRVQIGTLKALGYSKMSVASKYLNYAFSASILGSVIGILVGSTVLPNVIIGAYKILYQDLLVTVTPINITNSILATLVAVLCTTGATFFACYKELNEHAAQLMRPVAPKHGKIILLERIPFIWKRLSFSRKSTIRNIVRYKKRFFMTLFGIAGCMGLLMVGFGLRDSISSIVDNQYQNIWIYDATVTMSNKMSQVDKDVLQMEIRSTKNVDDGMLVHQKSVDVTNGEKEKSVYIFVPETTDKLNEFVVLQDRKTEAKYSLSDNGVIVSEKLAKQLGVSAGGKISIKEENVIVGEVTVTAVVENYMFNYVYMTTAQYEALYGKAPEFTDMYLTLHDTSQTAVDELATQFTGNEKITALSFVADMQSSIEKMMQSLNYVVVVLIISAGLLAIIVLYNLANINITERKRELATIKLLGFFDLELAQYVYRENIILTILGTAVGVVFGIFLHRFVIDTVEIDMIMFGKEISLESYFFSIVLTLVFAFIVNFWMYFKLKKIDMVESLKSVE